MKPWDIEQIRRATKSKWVARGGEGAAARAFTGRISTDSRLAAAGDLFVAIAGRNHDAHAYLPQVIEAHVAAALVHKDPPAEVVALARKHDVAILQTDDTVLGLNRLAAAYREEVRAKVIAVGGSNGKTTTKRIIHTLLAEKFEGHASPKSFNNNIGMPLTLLEVEPRHEYVVLEIGTNAPGEIAALGEVCRPDIAVITNIGLEHLEKLGDLAGVAQEEASIAPFVKDGGMIVLPADAPELFSFLKHTRAQRLNVGRAGTGADLQATDIVESLEGVAFGVNGRGTFRVPLLGEHNAINALLAIGVARRMGLTDTQIEAGLAKVTAADKRLEVVDAGGYFVINDAYNANPSSMAAALRTFGKLKLPEGVRRRVAILGDMLELGPGGAAMHKTVGTQVAQADVSVFVAIGPLMAHAADAAQAAGVTVVCFNDTAAAAASVPTLLKEGDAVLLKGSRGMALERILASLASATAAAAAR